MDWQLAEAKNRLSEVVRLALTEGVQRVRRRGDSVMIVSEAEYQRLVGERRTFKEHLLHPPASLEGVDFERDTSPMRDVSL